ncbi:hypothetical protein E8E12_005074 [Didymella heteroderae]|uniref:Uncharacterized protein n=1 Tax=Didymella heteroderae TaxID=1769908 RepID=A0A9P4WRE9_9PLEO|nr:hypothetical protein E8E12_005074 [Didymella heteroderae]
MAVRLTTPQLVEQMKGRDTLNGWDVLVSYNEAQVNALLDKRAQALQALTQNVSFTVNVQDDFDDTQSETYGYNLSLSSPKLRFSGPNGKIQLTFALTGSQSKGELTKIIPQNQFQVKIGASLANVRGELDDPSSKTADFKPAADAEKTKTPPNYVTLMPKQGNAAQGVCIDFKDPDMGVEIVWADSSKKTGIPDVMFKVGERLKKHFQDSLGLKYYIAGMSNAYDAGTGSTLLQPRKFCFSCTAGTAQDGSDGTLSIWVILDKGNDGQAQESSGKTSLTFHPSDADVHPIPLESNATVIFSHKVIGEYLSKAIAEKGTYDDCRLKLTPNEAGLTVLGKCKQKVQKSMKDFRGFQTGWKIGQYVLLSDLSFDMHATDTEFTLTKDGPSALEVKYDSGVQTLSWFRTTITGGIPEDKKVRLRFKHGGKANWVEVNNEKRPNLLKLSFDMPKQFEVTDKDATGKILFWDIDHVEIPEPYKDVSVSLTEMDFDLRGLDYFLTTNLILPGAKMFIADQTKPDDSKTHGLFVPRDVLLTGKIADLESL